MAKPGPKPTPWTGTSGNDTKVVASLTELKNTAYNAGAGYDTLDLSALTSGVSIQLGQVKHTPHSELWADTPFHGSWWDYNPHFQGGTDILDSILNFEKIIGTSGNDYLSVLPGGFTDGGAGDDALVGGSTRVGGLGSDQIIGTGNSSDMLVGGTFDGVHATPDGTSDEFFLSAGTVLDFELGTDHLYIDNEELPLTASWTDVNTSYGPAAQLVTAYGTTITLVGETASAMNQVPEGFLLLNDNAGARITSGPGDDFLEDGATNSPTTYIFGAGSGHDLLRGLDLNYDTLVFPDAPTASNTTYHGDPALLLTFDAGHSSVLLIGMTTADPVHYVIG
jgi:hypothetical protein